MPRFCSSNTRPNSLPIGRAISLATMLKPKPRLWPARSERASISRASGSCAANAFSRLRRRNSSQQQRQRRQHQAPPAGSATTWMPRATASGTPAAGHGQPRSAASLATVERRVGLFEQQVDVAEALEQASRTTPGHVVQRLGRARCLLGSGPRLGASPAMPVPVSRSRRSSSLCWCGLSAQQQRARRPPGRRLPTKRGDVAIEQGGHRSRSSPPSSRARGRRWTAAARRPPPAAT